MGDFPCSLLLHSESMAHPSYKLNRALTVCIITGYFCINNIKYCGERLFERISFIYIYYIFNIFVILQQSRNWDNTQILAKVCMAAVGLNGLLKLFFCVFSICGTLHSVDQFLNIKLTDISVTDPDKYPHMVWKCYVEFSILHHYFA
jgi:hypothetical protein